MGENEQGGMLRTVVVVGLVALIAAVVMMGVVGMKASMTKNTDNAVSTVATTKLPYELKNPNISYQKYTPGTNSGGTNLFPVVGDIPTGSWRDVKIVASSDKQITVAFDINNEFKSDKYIRNDNDDISKRSIDVYSAADGSLIKHMAGAGMNVVSNTKFTMDANTKYIFRVKYFNNSGKTFIETEQAVPGNYQTSQFTGMFTSSTNGEAYKFNVESFEAATYDDKYNE